MEKSARCNMCGSSQAEWDEDPDAYEAIRMMCPGCMRREVLSDDADAPKTKGMSIRLIPRAAAERMRADMARKVASGTERPHRQRSLL
jgi:hypothetical protein